MKRLENVKTLRRRKRRPRVSESNSATHFFQSRNSGAPAWNQRYEILEKGDGMENVHLLQHM